jgi:hypothetical protein
VADLHFARMMHAVACLACDMHMYACPTPNVASKRGQQHARWTSLNSLTHGAGREAQERAHFAGLFLSYDWRVNA